MNTDSHMRLVAQSPLNGFQQDFGAIRLSELTDHALVAIALPRDGKNALEAALGKFLECAPPLPACGQSIVSKDGKTRIMGMQKDQWFVLFPHDGDDAAACLAAKLKSTAYCTDQSDSWVMLGISGTQALAALARICAIDLHPDSFAAGAVARTVMEYIGAIVIRTGEDKFLLLAPRSFARSFLHAVTTSIRNVLAEP